VTWETGAALPGAFTVQNNADTNEIQRITETGGEVTGGTYTITFDGQTTVAIPFDAPLRNGDDPLVGTPDDIAEALGRLSNLEYFDLRLSGGPLPDTPVILTFVGAAYYGADQPEITIDDASLTGGGTYTPATDNDGGGKSDFDFPQFEGDLGFALLAVDVVPLGVVSGNFSSATGVMTTNAQNYQAQVAVGPPLNVNCNYTVNLAFSTADNSVYKGDLFTAGVTPPTSGAITDDWTTLPGLGPPCTALDGFVAGASALWLSNGIAAPTLISKPVATLPIQGKKKKKKCKKGFKLKKIKKEGQEAEEEVREEEEEEEEVRLFL
jgi:hypothetical protein